MQAARVVAGVALALLQALCSYFGIASGGAWFSFFFFRSLSCAFHMDKCVVYSHSPPCVLVVHLGIGIPVVLWSSVDQFRCGGNCSAVPWRSTSRANVPSVFFSSFLSPFLDIKGILSVAPSLCCPVYTNARATCVSVLLGFRRHDFTVVSVTLPS